MLLTILLQSHPETDPDQVSSEMRMSAPSDHVNLIGAAVEGASEGLKLALNVGAGVAMMALVNHEGAVRFCLIEFIGAEIVNDVDFAR